MMACLKGRSLNYDRKIVSDLFQTPTHLGVVPKVYNQYLYNSGTFRLCVGVAMSRCLEQIWYYFSDLVQWLTFPTGYHVTQLDNLGRSYSAPTEIARIWESFIFKPTWTIYARNHRNFIFVRFVQKS